MDIAENSCPALARLLGASSLYCGRIPSVYTDIYLEQEVHNTHYTNYKPTNISFDRALHRLIRSNILTYFHDCFPLEKKTVGPSVNPYIGLSR